MPEIKKKVGRILNKSLNYFGYRLDKVQNIIPRTSESNWLEKLDIQTIIDIGANEGQFILDMNSILPNRTFYAFEPIKLCYNKLLTNTKHIKVNSYNIGIGDIETNAELNLSNNFASSSLLKMEKLHLESYPESRFISKESIQIKTLDSIFINENYINNVLIKVDVQGYEKMVINGGKDTFKRASVVLIESIFESFYEGQWLFDDLYNHFNQSGFKFMGFLEQSYSRKTGIPLYADSIFIKNELIQKIL